MTAIKFDEGKIRRTLVDPEFIEEVARVLMFGAEKYGEGNWMQGGLKYTRVLDAMYRHMAAFETGEDFDSETGLPHVAHAATCAMFLLYYSRNQWRHLDDRRFKQHDSLPGVQEGAPDKRVQPVEAAEARPNMQTLQQHTADAGASTGTDTGTGTRGLYHPLTHRPDPVETLQERIAEWADRVYPTRTPEVAFAKMVGEVGEILANPEDPLEWADVAILLLDAAKLRGIDIVQASHMKMEINEKRTWKVDPRTGLMSHVKKERREADGTD